MISLGSRHHGRKAVELGPAAGGGEGRMEEDELEEGEAMEDDAPVDPDVDLSYIDKKIQAVLGHFQKDFEGTVSADNLGSRFGAYGSFLPTYQRSPLGLSQPKSPMRSSAHNAPRPPGDPHFEGARPSTAALTSLAASTKSKFNSATHLSDDSGKKDANRTESGARAYSPQHDASCNDQKTLKVRIKVGQEIALARDNAAIYSGLGLDTSPSPSLSPEEIPDGGELSPQFQDAMDESPSIVFQFYKCFQAARLVAYLLSPVCEHAMEKKMPFIKDSKREESTEPKNAIELPKNRKSVEKTPKSSNCKDGGNDVSVTLKKEIDVETPAGNRLPPDSLNIPSLSKFGEEKEQKLLKETMKGASVSKGPGEAAGRERTFLPDLVDDDHLNTPPVQGFGSRTDTLQVKGKLSSKPNSVDNVSQNVKMAATNDEVTRKHGKVVKDDAHGNGDSISKDAEGLKGRKDIIVGSAESVKVKAPQKALWLEQDGKKVLSYKDKPSGAKRKSDGSQSNGSLPMEVIQGSVNAIQVVRSKEKKKGLKSKEQSECISHASKHHEGHSRSANIQRKTVDAGLSMGEEGDHREETQQTISKNTFEDRRLDYEDDALVAGKPKEKVGSKRHENLPTYGALDNDSQAAIVVGNSSSTNAVPQPPVPVFIKENWVACDKCQKWRLLPYGTEPKHFPKKWLCSMLNWLPGMNKCCISEEETTKAVHALYLLPAPEGQVAMHGHNDVANSSITFADLQHNPQSYDPMHQSVSSVAKKKLVVKEASNLASQPGFSQPTHPVKENSSTSTKSRNLSNGNKFSQGRIGSQHTSMSTDFTMERQKYNLKEEKFLAKHSDEGDSIVQEGKKTKSKSRKDLAQDSLRTSKKMKSRDSCSINEDQHANHGLDGKSGIYIDDFSTKMHGRNVRREEFPPSMGYSHDHKDGLSHGNKVKAPVLGVSNGQAEPLSPLETEKFDTIKKRKMRDLAKSRVLQVNASCHAQEEVGDTVSRKVKKVRASKCEGREPNVMKMDDKEEIHPSKFTLASRDLLNGNGENQGDDNLLQQNERDLDGGDSVKRDFCYSQHSTAATSSSSKVSGSRKSKANFLEGRGSPVESVSSSPLRSANIDKPSNGRGSKGKDDTTNAGYSIWDSRRSSEGDANGSYEHFGPKSKEKSASVVNKRSLERRRAPESRALNSKTVEGGCNTRGREMTQSPVGKEDLFARIFGGTDDEPSPSECEDANMVSDVAITSEEANRFSNEFQGKDGRHWKERPKLCDAKGHSSQRKSAKSTSRQMDRQRNHTNETNKGVESQGNAAENREQKNPPGKFEKKHSIDNKRENCSSSGMQVNVEANGTPFSVDKHSDNSRFEENAVASGNVRTSHLQENVLRALPREEEKCRQILLDRLDERGTLAGRGKLESVSHFEDPQSREESVPFKGGRGITSVEATKGDVMNAPKHSKKIDSRLRNPTPNRADTTTPLRKDSGQATANAVMKEARDLKHAANRKKEEGLDYESAGLLFQSALKFLQVASLLEPLSSESAKHGDNTQWMQMYSETAKLCEFCAHEYEKLKELASAALAYKCMEVAYMKVVYFKHFTAVKDRHELQSAPHIGESPSSSASDVDNLNNHAMLDKGATGKGVNSPQVPGNYIIAARNRLNFTRILSFAEDVNCAMEASRKSLDAFASSSICPQDRQHTEGVASVRRVLDFSFRDVEGLLRLVRLSLDVIGR